MTPQRHLQLTLVALVALSTQSPVTSLPHHLRGSPATTFYHHHSETSQQLLPTLSVSQSHPHATNHQSGDLFGSAPHLLRGGSFPKSISTGSNSIQDQTSDDGRDFSAARHAAQFGRELHRLETNNKEAYDDFIASGYRENYQWGIPRQFPPSLRHLSRNDIAQVTHDFPFDGTDFPHQGSSSILDPLELGGDGGGINSITEFHVTEFPTIFHDSSFDNFFPLASTRRHRVVLPPRRRSSNLRTDRTVFTLG